MSLRDALDRTLLLMRDLVSDAASDDDLLRALTGTRVILAADEVNLSSHSAQSAYVTTALLLARSAHDVYLAAPNVQLVGRQPPLSAGRLIDQLELVGRNLLPGIFFKRGAPRERADVS